VRFVLGTDIFKQFGNLVSLGTFVHSFPEKFDTPFDLYTEIIDIAVHAHLLILLPIDAGAIVQDGTSQSVEISGIGFGLYCSGKVGSRSEKR